MEFAEKLNFLFDITQAEGKELASAMNVTPPQISKMRKGLRGLPRNREAAFTIALFFAQRCSSNEQKDALAKFMRMAQIRGANDENVLADMLLSWFLNEKFTDDISDKGADIFLHRLSFSSGARIPSRADATQPLHSAGNNITAYYGIEGKQTAYMVFYKYIMEKEKAYELCVLSDENNMWIDDDPSYASKYYDILLRLTEKGCFFKRIVGPLNNMEQAFYSLNRWYPLYLTGRATSFYYKRMRDELNRVTIFVVQDVAALFSFSVGGMPDAECVTFFTTDTKTIKTMHQLFKKYLAMCEPAMKTYNADTSEVQMHDRLLEYETIPAQCMQMSTSLSFITLPWETAVSLRSGNDHRSKDVFLSSFAKRYKVFRKNLEQYDFYDFVKLADINDIMAGMIPIPAGNILGNEIQYYSPASYLQHLKSVEYLLKHYNHYHIVIEPNDNRDEPILYVKENYSVLITRATTPFIIFDVSEHNLITAFTENMRRRIPNDIYSDEYRLDVLTTVQNLMGQIEVEISGAAKA